MGSGAAVPGNEERRLLVESARKYRERSYGFEARTRTLDEYSQLSLQRWREFAEMGWLGVGVCEAAGGYGSAEDQAALAEELGRALVVEPWLANAALVAPLLDGLLREGGEELSRAQVLTQLQSLVEGRQVMALAVYEPTGRYDAFDVRTQARPDGEGWLLNGHKTLVLGGAQAQRLYLLARTRGAQRDQDGLTLFALDAHSPGVAISGFRTYDGRPCAEVRLDQARVPLSAQLGELHGAWPVVERALDQATVMGCAEAVGAMGVAFETTREYLKTRKQFGRALTENQVIRHRLVDLFVALEQSRAITEAAASRLGDSASERARAVSLAKAFVSSAGRRVGEDSVQLHGAIGMTDEYQVGHCYKRLAAFANLFGDEQWHLDRLAAIDRAGPGARHDD